MSLNGLEATEINDAYQAALGEGGGWFVFLKRPQEKERKGKKRCPKLMTSSVGSYSIMLVEMRWAC